MVAAVEKATENFIERGELIAYENPDITQEMLGAVDEVRKTGSAMSIAAREFSEDPCSSLKRGNMVRASRNLLSAVTRLLILADMVDVHLLLKSLHVVEDDLDKLRDASSQDELLNNMRVSEKVLFFNRKKFWFKIFEVTDLLGVAGSFWVFFNRINSIY